MLHNGSLGTYTAQQEFEFELYRLTMRLSFSYNDAIASLYGFLGSEWSFME